MKSAAAAGSHGKKSGRSPRQSNGQSAQINPPALYDLTTLQRDANRLLGYTAQQTLDYAQSLYEKKLCTYPRTDSRYLTGDMVDGLPVLVNAIAKAMPFAKGVPITAEIQQVINDEKVSDHHAIIPTMTLKDTNLDFYLRNGQNDVVGLMDASGNHLVEYSYDA